jgi:flagellar hook protein FlgE
MIQAMLASVSSIEAQQTQMNVIGNNLANINTTAFKSSQVTFQDLIEQQLPVPARAVQTRSNTGSASKSPVPLSTTTRAR